MLGGDAASVEELPLSKCSFVLFSESSPGMAWTTVDIAIIAGELAGGPSSSQEGQRKYPRAELI